MSLRFASRRAGSYQVATPVYQGPLDLLLHLIERAELDITNLSLALVTDQYLEYLHNLPIKAAEEVSAFLVIAAKLLQIKSEALLPRHTDLETEEEDLGDSLVQHLIAYKKFKHIAQQLGERESAGLKTYLRLSPPPKVKHTIDLDGFDLFDLTSIAKNILDKTDQRPELNNVVAAPRITIREKISHIVSAIRHRDRATFNQLLDSSPTRLDVVVTFLAMLELVKRFFIQAYQESLFGEIRLERSDSWDDELDFESEFGE
ncbi:MAG: segregation/condensation protein A [Anaerolineales bacterium]|jgi:segregation and condensation protein A